jgi:hypothetical protein
MAHFTADDIHYLLEKYPGLFDGRATIYERRGWVQDLVPVTDKYTDVDLLPIIDFELYEGVGELVLTSRILSDGAPSAIIHMPEGYGTSLYDRFSVTMADGKEFHEQRISSVYSSIAQLPNLYMPEELDCGYRFLPTMRAMKKAGVLQAYESDFLYHDRNRLLALPGLQNFTIFARKNGTHLLHKDSLMFEVNHVKDWGKDLHYMVRVGKDGQLRITNITQRSVDEIIEDIKKKSISDDFNLFQSAPVPVSGDNERALCFVYNPPTNTNDNWYLSLQDVDNPTIHPRQQYVGINHNIPVASNDNDISPR